MDKKKKGTTNKQGKALRPLSAAAAKSKGGGCKSKKNVPQPATKKAKSSSASYSFDSSLSSKLLKCTNWKENSNFAGGKAPSAINFMSFQPANIPVDWDSQVSAKDAASLKTTLARYIGFVTLNINDIDEETVKMLVKKHEVAPHQQPIAKYSHLRGVPFNTDGEISTPEGQIPLSRLVDGQYNDLFKLSKEDNNLLDTLFIYQRPDGSDWRLPFIRCATNHSFNQETKKLQIFVYVYFSRLIFELIADPVIKIIIDRIEGSTIKKTPTTSLRKTKKIFNSPGKSKLRKDIFKYSLAGLLKYAESDGYPLAPQPDGLSVNMFDFQLSTYQWMLDQEHDTAGLNARFWETWSCDDGGHDMYYFEEAGEFRLTQPPVTTGGLLCEEMGLGKTLEVIAIVLGNPRVMNTKAAIESKKRLTSISTDKQEKLESLIDTKATLIVVPPTLIGQWRKEIQSRSEKLSFCHRCLSHIFLIS